MIVRAIGWTALTGGLLFLALVLVVGSAISIKIGAIILPALAIGGLLMLNPHAGLFLLVVLAQLDALANLISAFLPISLYKLLTAATVGGYLVMSYSKRQADRLGPRLPEMKYAVLFALWMILAWLNCEYKAIGLKHMIGFISTMVLFFLIVIMTDTAKKLEVLLWALVISGFVSGLVALAESFLGIRLLSTSDAATTAAFEGQARSAGASDYNPTTAAHMLLATTVIAAIMFISVPRLRWLSGLTMLVGIPALVLTFARSAAIAFVVVAIVFAFNYRKNRYFGFVLICVLTGAAAAVPFVPELYWERMWAIFDFGLDRTLERRLSYNIIGLELLSQHPVLGIGPGNFPVYYSGDEYRWYPGREPIPRQLHNSYLETAVETGLIGFAMFAAVMFSSLRKGIESVKSHLPDVSPLAEALSYAFGAFLVASVFMPNEDTKFMWILPALCVAAWRIAYLDRDKGQNGD